MGSLKDFAPTYLHTERLTLELFNHSPEHSKCLLDSMNSPTSIERNGEHGVSTPAQFDAMNAACRLRDARFSGGSADDDLYYVARLGAHNDKGNPIGGISLCQRMAGETLLPPDIGWCFLEEAMGKGYATEAAAEVLRWAREDFGLKDIIVCPSETNRPSNRVAEKLGFVEGGRVANLDQPGTSMMLLILPGMDRVEAEGGLTFVPHVD